MSIFGSIFVASTGRWIAFDDETLSSLSEHDTEIEALEACRRYLEQQMRCAREPRVRSDDRPRLSRQD